MPTKFLEETAVFANNSKTKQAIEGNNNSKNQTESLLDLKNDSEKSKINEEVDEEIVETMRLINDNEDLFQITKDAEAKSDILKKRR